METVERQNRRTGDRWVAPTRLKQAAANLLVLGLWLWLYRPVFAYLAILFSREEFRTNQIVLAGVLALIVLRARAAYQPPRGNAALRSGTLPSLLAPPS